MGQLTSHRAGLVFSGSTQVALFAREMRLILSVVSSQELLKLSEALSASAVDVPSIVELTNRGDLAKIAEIHTAHPALFMIAAAIGSKDIFLTYKPFAPKL
ncbi:hypothetical protein ACKWRH_08995 [Bradyrhizobium sp. Pa8]|uniref:hypothetical protein n=1 Tax=Bradyrhizobium sp. Pa8 TaxID=3386552 RepID=UPI00403F499F